MLGRIKAGSFKKDSGNYFISSIEYLLIGKWNNTIP